MGQSRLDQLVHWDIGLDDGYVGFGFDFYIGEMGGADDVAGIFVAGGIG